MSFKVINLFTNRTEAVRLFHSLTFDEQIDYVSKVLPMGNTILHILAEVGDSELFCIFAVHDTPLIKGLGGRTPFDIAVMCDNLTIVKFLLKRSPSINVTGLHIEHAIAHRNREMFDVLIDHPSAVGSHEGPVLKMKNDGSLVYVHYGIGGENAYLTVQSIHIAIAYRDPRALLGAIERWEEYKKNRFFFGGIETPTVWLICLVGNIEYPHSSEISLRTEYFGKGGISDFAQCVDALLRYDADPLKSFPIRLNSNIPEKVTTIEVLIMKTIDIPVVDILLSYAKSTVDPSVSKFDRKMRAISVKKCGNRLLDLSCSYGRPDVMRMLFHLEAAGKVQIDISQIRSIFNLDCHQCIIDELMLARKISAIRDDLIVTVGRGQHLAFSRCFTISKETRRHINSFPERITLFDLTHHSIQRQAIIASLSPPPLLMEH